jgi:hypothetical protein
MSQLELNYDHALVLNILCGGVIMGTHQTRAAVVKGSKKYRWCFDWPEFGFLKTLIEVAVFRFCEK